MIIHRVYILYNYISSVIKYTKKKKLKENSVVYDNSKKGFKSYVIISGS